MMSESTTWALSADLGRTEVWIAFALAGVSLVFLAAELYKGRRGRGGVGIAITGLFAVILLTVAVLRPVRIASRGATVGSRVVVLVDGSRSMDLPGDDGTRRETALRALDAFVRETKDARVGAFRFGAGAPVPLLPSNERGFAGASYRPAQRSDLATALEAIAQAADERPAAIVVLTDGRLDRPPAEGAANAIRAAMGPAAVPIHFATVATEVPKDAAIRGVRIAGAAVAHQPLALRVDVGCSGGLACENLKVRARELHEGGEPRDLASGNVLMQQGEGTVELSVTLDRSGTRILDVSIDAPSGDALPDNNRRFVTVDVTRDRVRVLHVAGRPTYDVRALRMWLKSDASVDLVAFFILRTTDDDVGASTDELALIPFPVDELFSQHLSSFDAVVLQDFNARPYGLERYLPTLRRYVERGGGLIMVGGPDAFVPGHYASSALAEVLPVDLRLPPEETGVDLGSFAPVTTEIGRAAPVLAPLRALIGDSWPEMPGTDVVNDARRGTIVLLEHPTRKTTSGAKMPVLALGEHGSGRSIALTIDGSHKLLFSQFAAESAAGRAHGAFWDALLGWLMKDPRFEPAVVDLPEGCLAGEDTRIVLRPLPGQKGEATIEVLKLGGGGKLGTFHVPVPGNGEPVPVQIGALDPGGYTVSAVIGEGADKGAAARRDFACEKGGDEWADPRPDPERIAKMAEATHGAVLRASELTTLPLPEATQVAAERRVTALLPPWVWTFGAAAMLGLHWIARRRKGLV